MRNFCIGIPLLTWVLKSLRVLVLLVPVTTLIAQKDSLRAEVMILGSYHMHNPGADVFNVKAEDVLTEEKQDEIRQVINDLKSFNPTMVALEIKRGSSRDSLINKEYRDYLKGHFTLDRWEGYQIGFRIAGDLGHGTIFNIDEPGDFPFQKMLQCRVSWSIGVG